MEKAFELPRPNGTLEFQGKLYTKLSQVSAPAMVVTETEKMRVALWLCMETASKLPARPVIVPEIID